MDFSDQNSQVIRIVVLGSGYAGFPAAFEIDKFIQSNQKLKEDLTKSGMQIQLLWVSRLDSFHFNTGMPRALVDRKAMHSFFVPIFSIWPCKPSSAPAASWWQFWKSSCSSNTVLTASSYSTEFLHADVKSILPRSVQIQRLDEDGREVDQVETLDFDYLICGLGSNVPSPMKVAVPSRKAAISSCEDAFNEIKNAKTVVVVGAGPTGLESCFEIKETYPACRVVLVDPSDGPLSRDLFMGNVGQSLCGKVAARLKERNIETYFKDRVVSPSVGTSGPCVVKLESGQEIQTDVVLFCVGFKRNLSPFSHLIKSHSECYNADNDSLVVNSKFQLLGEERIFVIGDLLKIGQEGQLAFIAKTHATFVSGLVSSLLSVHIENEEKVSAAINCYKAYSSPSLKLMALTTGRSSGFLQVSPNWVFGSWAINRLKCKDMMFGIYFSQISLSPPFASDFSP